MADPLENQELEIPLQGWERPATRLEDAQRRIRVMALGTWLADSRRVKLLLEDRKLPIYYFPPADVDFERLRPSEKSVPSVHKGRSRYWDVQVGDQVIEDAAFAFPEASGELSGIRDHVAFHWDKMDAWFEEDDEVFAHPRDPYHRVDVLNSSRHVRVEVDGVQVAESRRPRLLFETGLPVRYYLPKLDVALDRLLASPTRTRCPYKGVASYWSVDVNGKRHEDLVWSYPAPIPECPKIEGLLAFFSEHVDIWVDGELQERPRTPWS